MKVTLLGTGTSQGVPMIGCSCPVCLSMDFRDKRLRSSIHIETDQTSIVIDSGPDFRQQMLRTGVGKLDAVVFTHSHKDHIAGLDDVRAFNYKQHMDMPVYGTKAVHDQLRMEFYYAFEEVRYPGTPQLQLKEIDKKPFTINEVTLTPLPVMHHKLPVMGYRIGDFAYITDANFIPDETRALMKGLKVLVLNALQREKHLSHFNLSEALQVTKEIGADQTYYTHIGHRLGYHQDVSKELPAGVALGYDGLVLEI